MQIPTAFTELMDKAGKLYRIKVNNQSVEWYYDYLKSYSISEVREAFDAAFQTEEYFPSIAAIKKTLSPRQSRDDFRNDPLDFKDLTKQGRVEIGRDCLKLIFAKLNKEISKEDYYQGMLELEKKYPRIQPLSFSKAAEMYKAGKRLI